VTDPGALAPDSSASVRPFEIIPVSKVEFLILEESLHLAGARNSIRALAVDVRKRIVALQRTKGPDLYRFVLSGSEPADGSGVCLDDLHQVAWSEYLGNMESTSAWGSHLEIQSAAVLFEAKIYIWELRSTGYVFHSVHGSGKQVWHFGFESERHYHFMLHGSDHEGMRNLVVHLGASPCISRTTPYRGSSEALLIGVCGDGNCLFSTIAMAALACGHPLVASHFQLPDSTLQLQELPHLAEAQYMAINAESTTGQQAANAEMLHLCQVSGHPLGEGSVVSDATQASLMMLSAAAAAHSGIAKLHKDIVWVFHLLDRWTYCGARWKAEAIRRASSTGLRLKVTKSLPSSFDGFTHVTCDGTTSCGDVEKALGSNSVNLIIVVDSQHLEELLVQLPVDFQLVNVHGGTRRYALFMRVHRVQQSPSPRQINVPSRNFNATSANILPTNVGRSAPPKFNVQVIKDGLNYTVLPNVAATMHRPNGTVTYIPGQYLRLQVKNAIMPAIYRGIVQSGQSDSVIVYSSRGKIGAAPPSQVRGLNKNTTATDKMTSEEIAEGVRAWLMKEKEEEDDVVIRNLTDEFSNKVHVS
jgi:hypothetical protein